MVGEGVLTSTYEPTPAFEAIKEMLHKTFMTRVELALPVDGKADFRGFHGDYDVSVTLADGTVLKTKLALEPGAKTEVKLKVNRAKGVLEVVK
jgi:hypothetical protein